MHQRSHLLRLALAAISLTACAETAPPPAPPEEIVVVLNTTGATLSLVPVTAPTQISTVPLGASDVHAGQRGHSGRHRRGAAAGPSALAVVDLREQQLVNTIELEPGSGLAGAALINDSIAYVVQRQPEHHHPGGSDHRRHGQPCRRQHAGADGVHPRPVAGDESNLDSLGSRPERAGSASSIPGSDRRER